MEGLDVASVAITSTVVALSLSFFLLRFYLNTTVNCGSFTARDLDKQPLTKEKLSLKVLKATLTHVKTVYTYLFLTVVVLGGLLVLFDNKAVLCITFLAGGLTCMLSGFLALVLSGKAPARAIHLSSKSKHESYLHLHGVAVAVATSTLLVNLVTLFVLLLLLKTFGVFSLPTINLFFAFISYSVGAIFVASFLRFAGGVFTKPVELSLEAPESALHKDLPFFLDGVYLTAVDLYSLFAVLFTAFLWLMPSSAQGVSCLTRFGHLAFPLVLLSFFLVVHLVVSFFVELLLRQNLLTSLLHAKFVALGLYLAVVLALFPLCVYLFLPDPVEDVAYNGYIVFGLLCLGLFVFLLLLVYTYFTCAHGSPFATVNVYSIVRGLLHGMAKGSAFSVFTTLVPLVLLLFIVHLCLTYIGPHSLAFVCLGAAAFLPFVQTHTVFGALCPLSKDVAVLTHAEAEVVELFDGFCGLSSPVNASLYTYLCSTWTLVGVSLLSVYKSLSRMRPLDALGGNVYVTMVLGFFVPLLFVALCVHAASSLSAPSASGVYIKSVLSRGFSGKLGRSGSDGAKVAGGDGDGDKVGAGVGVKVEEGGAHAAAPESLDHGSDDFVFDYKDAALFTKKSLFYAFQGVLLVMAVPLILGFIFGPHVLFIYLCSFHVSAFITSYVFTHLGALWETCHGNLNSGKVCVEDAADTRNSKICNNFGLLVARFVSPALNLAVAFTVLIALLFAPLFLKRLIASFYAAAVAAYYDNRAKAMAAGIPTIP